MKTPAKILVIDDVPRNVKLLADLLTVIRTQLKRRLIDPINGMVSVLGFVVLNTISRVAGKEIIQWRTLQEQTYTRK